MEAWMVIALVVALLAVAVAILMANRPGVTVILTGDEAKRYIAGFRMASRPPQPAAPVSPVAGKPLQPEYPNVAALIAEDTPRPIVLDHVVVKGGSGPPLIYSTKGDRVVAA